MPIRSSPHERLRLACPIAALALALVVAPSAAVEPTPDPSPGAGFSGTWTLDPDRSASFVPVLEALEAPWYLRALAGRARPTWVVSADRTGLRIATKSPLGDRDQEFRADGEPHSGKDVMNHDFRQTCEWSPEGALVADRNVALGDERSVRMRIAFQLEEGSLVQTTQVRAGEPDEIRVRRVFSRASGDRAPKP